MGAFQGLNDAQVSGDRPKLKPGGEHLVEIDSCQLVNGHFGLSYVVEGQVLESTLGQSGAFGLPIRGLDGNQQQKQIAMGKLKAFLAAAFGIDPNSDQQWEQIADLTVTNPSSIATRRVRVATEEAVSREGRSYTRYTFAPATDGQH